MNFRSRAMLHRNDLSAINRWLKLDGWKVSDPKGYWEVIRAKKGKRWFIAYDRDRGDHFTVQGDMMRVVSDFLRWKKEGENNEKRL